MVDPSGVFTLAQVAGSEKRVVSSNSSVMVAEQFRSTLLVGERISERIGEQIADVRVSQVVEQVLEAPKNSSQDQDLQGTVEQMTDDPVLEIVEDGIQRWTAERIVDIPQVRVVERTGEIPQLLSDVQVPQWRVVAETAEIQQSQIQEQTVIDDVFQEGKLKEASRGHEWLEGEQVMSVKDPGPRFDHWNPWEGGSDLARQGHGVSGHGQVIGVSQESGPELAWKPRSPPAKQIWVKWEGRSRAVDFGGQMGKRDQEMVGRRIQD